MMVMKKVYLIRFKKVVAIINPINFKNLIPIFINLIYFINLLASIVLFVMHPIGSSLLGF
jgi:hypothetical protein